MVTDADVRAAADDLARRGYLGPFWIGQDAARATAAVFPAGTSPALAIQLQLVRTLTQTQMYSGSIVVAALRGVHPNVYPDDPLLAAIGRQLSLKFRKLPNVPARPPGAPGGGRARPSGGRGGGLSPPKPYQRPQWCQGKPMPHGIQFPMPECESPALDPDLFKSGEGEYATVHRVYMMLAFALLAARGTPANLADHNIAALLVASDGKILGWAVNRKSVHPLLHAEATLVLDWHAAQGRPLPADARVYTTLQSCQMCAAILLDAMPEVFVYYGQLDFGGHAARTALTLWNRQGRLPRDITAWSSREPRPGNRNLGSRLADHWQMTRSTHERDARGRTAWFFLREHAQPEFAIAQERLKAKVDKYHELRHEDAKPLNPQVKSVIRHVVDVAQKIARSEKVLSKHGWAAQLRVVDEIWDTVC